ncbi:MAG: glycosyltransferase family 4 protein [Pseudomonadota bacterium]
MKVVILNDASVARGGATGLALLQAQSLAARGIKTTFVTGDRGEEATLAAQGVAVVALGHDPLMRAPPHVAATRGLWSRRVAADVAKLVAAQDTPDTVYHVHSWSKTLTPSVFTALRSVAARVFIHAHDFFLACPNGGYMDYRRMQACDRVPLSYDCLTTNCDKRSYAQKLWRVSRQRLLRRALPPDAPWGGVLMIHPAMAPHLERGGWPPHLLQTLRNPATPLISERVRAEDNSGALFIGRVEAEKGVEDAAIAAGIAGLSLTVVGEGPLRQRLTQRYPNVRFTGWLDRQAIGTEAARARVVVMPSRYPEPFGLVAAEASLSGLPVLTSQTAFLGPEITSAGLGMMCDTRDPTSFAAALSAIEGFPAASIAEISRRGRSGAAGLSTTPDCWIDMQIAFYNAALKPSAAA